MQNNDTPLRRARKARELTLQQVADAVGIDTGSLSRIEKGKQGCAADTAERLAKFFAGAVTELEILYPERYVDPKQAASAAVGG